MTLKLIPRGIDRPHGQRAFPIPEILDDVRLRTSGLAACTYLSEVVCPPPFKPGVNLVQVPPLPQSLSKSYMVMLICSTPGSRCADLP